MRLIRYSELEWEKIPPESVPSNRPRTLNKTLAESEPGRVGAFLMAVRQYPESKPYPLHRHKIDQIRYTLVGDSPSGPDISTPAGSMIYVSSGTFYGPYDRPAGLEQLSLEFDGADSAPAYKKTLGPGQHLPNVRFTTPVQINPKNFRWIDIADGVQIKELGTFTERDTRVSMVGIDPGSHHTLQVDQTTIIFVDSGNGQIESQEIGERDGITVEPDDQLVVTAGDRIELILFGMPKLEDD